MNTVTKQLSKGRGYMKQSLEKSTLMDMLFGIRKHLEKEQKELLFHKKSRQEELEYFSFIKFIFSSPNKI